MPKPKSERPLSTPFAEHAVRPLALRLLAAGALALTLAACGSSAPRQADADGPPEAVAAEPVAAQAPEPERRRERRNERRGTDDAPEAVVAIGEPVPDAAAAAYARALGALRAEDWLEAELELEQLTLE